MQEKIGIPFKNYFASCVGRLWMQLWAETWQHGSPCLITVPHALIEKDHSQKQTGCCRNFPDIFKGEKKKTLKNYLDDKEHFVENSNLI